MRAAVEVLRNTLSFVDVQAPELMNDEAFDALDAVQQLEEAAAALVENRLANFDEDFRVLRDAVDAIQKETGT